MWAKKKKKGDDREEWREYFIVVTQVFLITLQEL